jgi:glycosyltransferase involved in cell wall biosynthesis
MQNQDITILIRTYNEELHIRRVLDAVITQKCEKFFEIIVVDSGSTDNTLSIVKEYPVRLISIPRQEFTFGRALNVGCEAARGMIIVSLSADATPRDTTWLAALVAPLMSGECTAIYGREIPYKHCDPVSRRVIASVFQDKPRKEKGKIFFANSNSAFRKAAWEALPFDATIAAAEDYVWAKEIVAKGGIIYYEPKACVYHSHRFTPRSFFSRHRNELYSRYKVIDKKSVGAIIRIGFANMIYGIWADVIFLLKTKRLKKDIARSFLYEAILMGAFIQAAFKK